jgi:hypothetical protein
MMLNNDNNDYGGSPSAPLSEIGMLSMEIYLSIEELGKQLQRERLQRFIDHLSKSLEGE